MTVARHGNDVEPADGELCHQETTVRGRYWYVPAKEGPAVGTLVGFHGYGETSRRLLLEMRQIPGIERWSLLAIQALHSFYTRSGRVVASWMTKLDRELAIEDNLEYVSRVIETAAGERDVSGPFVYLGFSQGTAMAYRAGLASRRRADALIALAGDVPGELEGAERPFPPTLIGRGSEDSWYSAEKEEVDRALLEAAGSEVQVCRFDGGHVWTDDFRAACGRFLGERVG